MLEETDPTFGAKLIIEKKGIFVTPVYGKPETRVVIKYIRTLAQCDGFFSAPVI